jgi:hypothetical protein
LLGWCYSTLAIVGRPTAAYWPDRGGRQRGGEVGRRRCCRLGGGGGRLGWHQGGGIRVGEGGGRALTEGGEAEKEMVEGPRWSWRGQGRPGGRASVGGAGRTGTGDSAGEATGRQRTMGGSTRRAEWWAEGGPRRHRVCGWMARAAVQLSGRVDLRNKKKEIRWRGLLDG